MEPRLLDVPSRYRSGSFYRQSCSCESSHEDGNKSLCLTPAPLTSGTTYGVWTLLSMEIPHPGPVIELTLSDLSLRSNIYRTCGTVRPGSDDSLHVLSVPLNSGSSREETSRRRSPAPTACWGLSSLLPQVKAVSYYPNTAVACHASPHKGGGRRLLHTATGALMDGHGS